MKDIDIPLIMLAPGEDVALARAVEAGVYARHLLRVRGPDRWLERVVEHGRLAEETLWWVGLRIARKQARRLEQFSGLPGDDLFQESSIAVAHAIRSYDHTRGVRYTTFVWHLVRQGLHDAVGVRITGGNVSRGDRRARLLVDHIRAERPGLGLDAATTLVRASRPAALRARMAQIPFDESLHSVDRGDVWEGATPTGLGFLELLDPLHRAVLTAHYLAPGTSLAAVGAQMGVSGTTVMRWEREACRAARRLLSAERTELPSISRARPPGASSCASQARSVARTGRGARSDP